MDVLGQGNVAVSFTNRQITLKPSIQAVRFLSRKYQGLQPLVTKLEHLDFEAVVDVITAGLNMFGNPKAYSELETEVYNTSIAQVVPDCMKYVAVLMNGGKALPESAGAPPDPNPPAA